MEAKRVIVVKKAADLKMGDEVMVAGKFGIMETRPVHKVIERNRREDDLFILVEWFDQSRTTLGKTQEVLVLDTVFVYSDSDRA